MKQYSENDLSISRVAWLILITTLIATTVKNSPAQVSADVTVNIAKHQNWAVQCLKDEKGDLASCFMYQRLLVKDSEDSLLRMTVDKPNALDAPRAIFAIPLGTYVTPGILVKIDNAEPLQLEIEYCDKQGCYAGMLLQDSALEAFKRGRQAIVSFQNRGRQQINLPISLIGFSAGLAELE